MSTAHNIGLSNKQTLPASQWFESLNAEDKKSVIGYLANYADRKCLGEVTNDLQSALVREGNSEKLDYYSIEFTPLDELAEQRIGHLDHHELGQMKSQIEQPFNLRFVIEEQGLYPPTAE
ncbi:hypothetical protein [Vibrio mexicanus]|uniref:hypothetical protein n=1 Tax=Vibrio mexicanus TaxID=1004326 RepID=UPI00063CB407|nr:hypothetical protein [Vibrio mexicanus]